MPDRDAADPGDPETDAVDRDATDRDADAPQQRQRIIRVAGRRARLTPAPGTDPSPEIAHRPERAEPDAKKGPNDDQLLRDVPPHY